MVRLIEHGGETEELPFRRLVHDDFLLVLIDGRNPHCTGDQDVSLSARVANFPDALARSEVLDLDLRGQDRSLFVVEQGKQGDTFQHLGAAGHQSPLKLKWISGGSGARRSVQKDVINRRWATTGGDNYLCSAKAREWNSMTSPMCDRK